MKLPEYLMTCLGEEGVEVALELSKVACKTNRFGIGNRSIVNPHGPTNGERLVDELNDLIAVADYLAKEGFIPLNWQSDDKQAQKTMNIDKFIKYAKERGRIEE